ncbi:hypothetical protein DFS34DRAFT_647813 [Phlyctochytrium arcticum]|nr:hypothetical protein DFS34DRAFT_647813 [Phlyctochytrium arcticum]
MNSWSTDQVAEWLGSLGFGVHERKFRENGISGDILVHAGHDLLKELDIRSVGHRISLLRSIYNHKISFGLPFESDDYIPESVTSLPANLAKDPEDINRLRMTVKDQDSIISRLSRDIEQLTFDLNKMRDDLSPVWAMVREYEEFEQKKKSGRSDSKKLKLTSSHKSSSKTSAKVGPVIIREDSASPDPAGSSLATSRIPRTQRGNVSAMRIYTDRQMNRESEPFKTVQVSILDTCAEILPEILRRYKIRNDWQQYALFMRHNGTERCLSFDEKPLALLQELTDDMGAPTFTFKHIKQITSPASRLSDSSAAKRSSVIDNGSRGDTSMTNAVAVYEYQATLDDEVDVAIGDRFRIVQREQGWCIVEKDGKLGWVPEGCLAQTEGDDVRESEEPVTSTQHGVVLYDYTKISPNELSIKKGDHLLIRNKYEHWLLAVCQGDSGWVPSCYVSILDNPDGDHEEEPKSAANSAGIDQLKYPPYPPKPDDSILSGDRSKSTSSTLRARAAGNQTSVSKLTSLVNTIANLIEKDLRSSAYSGSTTSDRSDPLLRQISGILKVMQEDFADDFLDETLNTCLEIVGALSGELQSSQSNESRVTLLERLQDQFDAGSKYLGRDSDRDFAQNAAGENLLVHKFAVENAFDILRSAVAVLLQRKANPDEPIGQFDS